MGLSFSIYETEVRCICDQCQGTLDRKSSIGMLEAQLGRILSSEVGNHFTSRDENMLIGRVALAYVACSVCGRLCVAVVSPRSQGWHCHGKISPWKAAHEDLLLPIFDT